LTPPARLQSSEEKKKTKALAIKKVTLEALLGKLHGN
jgi:hypothetical protein